MPRKKKNASRGASRGHAPGKPKRGPAKPRTPHGRRPRLRRRPTDYAVYEREEATPEYMRRLFKRHGMPVADRELDLFWQYYCLLREQNGPLDLTRIIGIEATVLKHFVDSAVILNMIELDGPVLDIGSGPGFPGAPLAILRPDLEFILAESRGRRVDFLKELKQRLDLKNVQVHGLSIRQGDDQPQARTVVTRALEIAADTLKRVRKLVPPGGRVMLYKGPSCEGELRSALKRHAEDYALELDRAYCLPGTDQERRLLVFLRQ